MNDNFHETEAKKKSKKELKIDRNKQIIIDAAEKLFVQYGFESVTMDQIADASFFSKTTIYKYFDRKEDLYIILASKAYTKLAEEFQKELVDGLSGLDLTYNMGIAYFRFFNKNPLYRKAFDYVSEKYIGSEKELSKNPKSKALLDEFKKNQQLFLEIWISVIKKGIEDNSINPKLSPELYAFIIGQMTSGFLEELTHSAEILNFLKVPMNKVYELALDIIKKGISNLSNQ